MGSMIPYITQPTRVFVKAHLSVWSMKEKGCFQYSNLHKSPCLRCFCLVSFVLNIQGQPLQGVFCGGQAIRKRLESSRMRNIEPAPQPAAPPPPPVTTTAVLFRFVWQPSPKGPWFVTTTIHSATPREVRHRKSSALTKIVSPVLSRSRESHANLASWEMRSCDFFIIIPSGSLTVRPWKVTVPSQKESSLPTELPTTIFHELC